MENAPATTNRPMPNTTLGIMQTNMSRQPILKQIGFLLGIAASIALGGYILMWSQSPSYQVLFSGMDAKESAEVVQNLQQMNIDYKLDPSSGALMVPASKVQDLRMRMAALGLPHSSAQGMEMLNQDQGFGTSQFIERARYQRAMEEELARSIAELQNIRAARVHLAVPKQSVFVRDRRPPTASVVLSLYAGRTLEQGQVDAITHMVASAVPNLTSGNVTVVDQKGDLLTRPERDSSVELSDSQLQYTHKLEQTYIRRIEDILAPIVGLDGVRAQVAADVDFTMTEQTHENYNPDSEALRSEQIEEQKTVGSSSVGGVPGALSNQPPGGGVAPEQTSANGNGSGNATGPGASTSNETSSAPGSSSKTSTRNFEVDRTISHQRMAPGRVRKLSVAVLVDDHQTTNASGKVTSKPLSEDEMKRINALVMDAIGFNKARGDSLNIVNAPFVEPAPVEPLPAEPIWKQAWVWDLGKQILGGLVVLFILLGIIRPAFKDLNKVPAGSLKNSQSQDGMTPEQALASGKTSSADIAKLTTGSEDMESQINNVRSLVQQDPALVAQVVKNWTASDA